MRIAILIGFIATVMLIEFFQHSNLVNRIPIPLTLIGAAGGALFGLWVAVPLYISLPDTRSFRQILGVLGIPAICLFAGTFAIRSIVLHAAFIDVESRPIEAGVTVVNRETYGGRRFGRRRVTATIGRDARQFRILVDSNLYSKVGPKPPAGLHCLKLTVLEGRWGYRKVLSPNYFDDPLGLDSYLRC